MASGLVNAAAAAAETTSPQLAAAAPADAKHVAVRDAIWRLERLLRYQLDGAARLNSMGAHRSEPKLSELVGLFAVLRESARKPGSADVALGRKLDALEPLLHEVERRQQARDASQFGASVWDRPASASRLDGGHGSTCAEAIALGGGRFAAAIGSRAGAANGDLWLRYTAATGGVAAVSTAGSDFDTVVEVYDSCPSAGETPVARGDDEVGLQSRASFKAAKGDARWIRISGADGATGTLAVQVEGFSSAIEGVVTNEATGTAPSYGYVRIWTAAGGFVNSGYIYGDGSYSVDLAPGTYFATTAIDDDDGLLDELYDDLPCAGGPPQGCSLAAGHPITVPNGTVVGGIDFGLGHGAAVAGRVRDAATGGPLADVVVNLYGSAGQPVTYAYTDAAGRFLIRGLASGVAFATAAPYYSGPYRRELYQNIGCAPSCDVTTGTPISVTVGQTTPGIDFDLERPGAISGTVTRQSNGAPITYGYVTIWDDEGDQRSYAWTDASGVYVAGGLDDGHYYATTETWSDFVDELYDDKPCDPSCDPTTGTPVPVTLGQTTAGIDFALRRTGTIAGDVTDAVSGDPISYFWDYPTAIDVFDASGSFVTWTYSFDGPYQVTGLLPGTYYLRASNSLYRAELYDDIPCPTSCDPTTGTAVTVALDGDVTGIDFALTPLGKIAGTVVDSATNAPIYYALVQVWNPAGQLIRSVGTFNGAYEAPGLPDGNYYVTASETQYLGELYDDVPCPGGTPAGCNLATGTIVATSLGNTTTGIDFALVRKGRIQGTVRAAADMLPVSWARIWVFGSGGALVASTTADSGGNYDVPGLVAGNYYVVADGGYYETYDAEVYDNVPCPSAACNPTIGTPVPVALNTTTSGIDFALSVSHAITGVVIRPDGTPAQNAGLTLYDSSGSSRGYAYTDSQGRYELFAEPGTWYVIVNGGYDFASQLYSGIPCPGGCNVTSGTPVVVNAGANTTGIDFALTYAHGIAGRVTDAGHGLSGVAIDLWNAAGEHVASTVTAANGSYHLETDPGTYFVSTDSGMGAIEELWNNVPCPQGPAYQGLCDPTTGTPITIANWDSLAAGIDFALDGVQLFANGFEPGSHAWSAWSP